MTTCNTESGGKLVPLAMIVGVVCVLGSCGAGHLSRPQAKSLLEKQHPETQDTHPLITEVGTVSGTCFGMPGYDPVESDKGDALLSAAGYIAIRPIREGVWKVELTRLGSQAAGEKYAHKQATDCDGWQVDFDLARYDHLDVTGIAEDGAHAKVDASMTFAITPAGLAIRKRAPQIILDADKGRFGENLAHLYLDEAMEGLLGRYLANSPPDKDRYTKQCSFAFEKYDDGWKATAFLGGNSRQYAWNSIDQGCSLILEDRP